MLAIPAADQIAACGNGRPDGGRGSLRNGFPGERRAAGRRRPIQQFSQRPRACCDQALPVVPAS
jgi:hypothetical protein